MYIDASVLLRIVFVRPDRFAGWDRIDQPISSELIAAECFRTIDRLRIRGDIDDGEFAMRRNTVIEHLDAFRLVDLDRAILSRAGEPFPTALGTLDAIHLATAFFMRDEADAKIATHDRELAIAGQAMGFEVHGI